MHMTKLYELIRISGHVFSSLVNYRLQPIIQITSMLCKIISHYVITIAIFPRTKARGTLSTILRHASTRTPQWFCTTGPDTYLLVKTHAWDQCKTIITNLSDVPCVLDLITETYLQSQIIHILQFDSAQRVVRAITQTLYWL